MNRPPPETTMPMIAKEKLIQSLGARVLKNIGYIKYTNYKGFAGFSFDFKDNEFDTYKGELLYIAYATEPNGAKYTFRLNKDGDNLISYMYYGHWTREEILKRVTETIDDHFGEDSLWYYEDDFVIVETEMAKYKYKEKDNIVKVLDGDNIVARYTIDHHWTEKNISEKNDIINVRL